MSWISSFAHLSILVLFQFVIIACSEQNRGQSQIGCQQKSTIGRDYVGEANTTVDGIPCQRWSDTQPHDHSFTHVGDHNFCRNPVGDPFGVWCYTTDPEIRHQFCPVPFCPPFKALDFSLDNDFKSDDNNSYTHASLQKENLPPSFTICTAFMVEAWNEYQDAQLFGLLDDDGEDWHLVEIFAQTTYTQFSFQSAGLPVISNQSKILFYPLQWTRVCLSKDSNTSLARLVVDGEIVIEKEVKVKNRPRNLNLGLGMSGFTYEEPGKTTNLNIFSSALNVEQMKSQTSPGEKQCGLQGDFLSWEKSLAEEQWTLHSKARWVELDGGPCSAIAKMNVFPMINFHLHSDCMKHCEKLGGRSPSVKTEKEWDDLLKGVKAISPDPSKLPTKIWLSATEGDIGSKLGKHDHWPEGIKAEEGVWRDFYTGEQLKNQTRPWYTSNEDTVVGEAYNCIYFYPKKIETRTWEEWECHSPEVVGCPCTYDSPPLIFLRGFCPDTDLEHDRYTVTQSATVPKNIIMVGYKSARIEYNSSSSQWVYFDPGLNIRASSRASHNSFVLGKHNWTVSGDSYQCFDGKDYTLELKLTGCNNTQFTCDDGQCVKMEERCDQVPDCEDKSDELNCKILALEKGYNQRVPPVRKISGNVKQVEVNVSLILFKVVAIEEEDHSIKLQFQINLEWKESRATYHNLKRELYLNALTQDEINSLWLPLVVYLNTDQQETTRLGWVNEWSTYVNIKREGNFTRSGYEVLDETYLFKGDENSLVMTQSYTHDFQCVYHLQKYPFDTQVGYSVANGL